MDTIDAGWIWCDDDGFTIVGMALDGTVVQLGMCLITKPSRKPGYPIIPMDAATKAYLESNPTPDRW